jgi:hypothetical protein
MLSELDTAVLVRDLPEFGLKAGDIGTIVLIHRAKGYDVEFMTLTGRTVAVTSLSVDEVRPIAQDEIAHAREL